MPTDAHDAVLGDFARWLVPRTNSRTSHTTHNICRGRHTLHPAAVLTLTFTYQPIVSTALHMHAPTIYFRFRRNPQPVTRPCMAILVSLVSTGLSYLPFTASGSATLRCTALGASRGATGMQRTC